VPFLPIGKISAVSAGINEPKPELHEHHSTEVFEFEPDEETVLGELLPHSLNFQMHQILLETKASEQSARMVAMKNATDNAGDLLEALKRTYNRQRQAQITQEIAELVGGAAALQG
jgi:F-type H+-transporting ATPase subunit gamma